MQQCKADRLNGYLEWFAALDAKPRPLAVFAPAARASHSVSSRRPAISSQQDKELESLVRISRGYSPPSSGQWWRVFLSRSSLKAESSELTASLCLTPVPGLDKAPVGVRGLSGRFRPHPDKEGTENGVTHRRGCICSLRGHDLRGYQKAFPGPEDRP